MKLDNENNEINKSMSYGDIYDGEKENKLMKNKSYTSDFRGVYNIIILDIQELVDGMHKYSIMVIRNI